MSKTPAWVMEAAKEIAAKWTYKCDDAESEMAEVIARHAFELPALPESLAVNPAFIITYQEWIQYLREKNRGKKLTPMTLKKHIRQFEKWGAEKSIASIEQSISRNWTGLFEVKEDLKKVVGNSKPFVDNFWAHDLSQVVIEIQAGGTDWKKYRRIVAKSASEAPDGTRQVSEYLLANKVPPASISAIYASS